MENGHRRLFEFERFRLDGDERFLLNDGAPVPLSPKAVELLIALVEKAGHVVSKDELMDTVWAEAFVEEANLTQSIFILRKALGETKDGSRFIETIPRRGYRFICPVRVIRHAENGTVDSEPVHRQPTPGRLPDPVAGRSQGLSERWKSFFAPIGLAAVSVILVGLATNNFYRSESQGTGSRETISQSPTVSMRRLTSDSRAHNPAISPDGKLLAYKRVEENAETVWLKDITTGSDIQIRPPSAEGYVSLVFSPDGSELYYTVRKRGPDGVRRGVIMRSPIFGGVERRVAEGPWSNFTISPDGRQLAFTRSSGKLEGDRVVIVVDIESGGERTLAKSEHGKFIFELWATSPSWSPDGTRVLVCGVRQDEADDRAALFDVRLEDGAVSELAVPRWHEIFQATWLADGSGLLVVARETADAPLQVWRLLYPSGEAVRITNDLNDYGIISFSPQTETLVAQQEIRNAHIWVMPDGDTARARQLTVGTNAIDGSSGMAWMPDGRVIFSSNRGGSYDLWTVSTDGSELRQLTSNSVGNHFPRVSADGRYIVFVSERAGKANLWRMNVDGTNLIQLTKGGGETWPSISPDSRWVYFSNIAHVPGRIEKVSIDGGEPSVVPNESTDASGPVVSPDGKLLAFYSYSEALGTRTGILPVEGGGAQKFLELQGSRGREEWTADSRGLIYIRPGFLHSNLWRESLDGKELEQVTHFSDNHISYFAYSPDHSQLALARGNRFSDVVLIENFK